MRKKTFLPSETFYNLTGIAIALGLTPVFWTEMLWMVLIFCGLAYFALFRWPRRWRLSANDVDRLVLGMRCRLFVLRYGHVRRS